MSLVNLTVYPRSTTGKNANRRTRAVGRVPSVLYGRDRTTETVELDAHALGVALTQLAGRSAIFQLAQEGVEEVAIALLREVQRHPVTDEFLHVDLMEIPRGEVVTVAVSVEVIGTNQTIKTGEGSVALSMTSVEVSCLPRELPDCIEIDVTELDLNDKIFVKDVKTPAGEIVSDPEALILNIKPASIFLEEEEAEGEGEGEGEEGAEGETAEGEADAKSDDEKSD